MRHSPAGIDGASVKERTHAARFAADYEAHYGRLRDQIGRRVGDRHTAEDLAQEIFADHLERPESYDPEIAPLGAWLATIGRNRATDHLRRRRFSLPEEPERLARRLEDARAAAPEPPPWLDFETLAPHLERLTRPQRRVIFLRYWHRKTTDVIASHLGISEAAVRKHESRALRHLERRLVPLRERETASERNAMSLRWRFSPVLVTRRMRLAFGA